MTRIVIHRDRTFTYEGRTFRVNGTYGSNYQNPGYGYTVEDVRTGTDVAEGYTDLSEIREKVANDIALWRQSHSISTRPGMARGATSEVRCSCGHEETFPTLDAALDFVDSHYPESRWMP